MNFGKVPRNAPHVASISPKPSRTAADGFFSAAHVSFQAEGRIPLLRHFSGIWDRRFGGIFVPKATRIAELFKEIFERKGLKDPGSKTRKMMEKRYLSPHSHARDATCPPPSND
jgi:hypothetical protein